MLATSPQHHREGKHLQAKPFFLLPPSLFYYMYKMENVLYNNVPVAYEAGGSWKVGDENAREGRRERGNRSGVKSTEESPRELGMEGGGKVWKLADRTGYAQTGSQAQTWAHYLSIWNTSPVSPSPPSLKKNTINPSPSCLPSQHVIPHPCLKAESLLSRLLPFFSL